MPRDYKSRANRPQSRKCPSGWMLFTSGLVVGLFASGLVWLKWSPEGMPETPQASRSINSHRDRPPVEPDESESRGAPKPRFDFYTILPEMEVVVPEPKPEPRNEPAPDSTVSTAKKPAPAAPGRYVLQMGSFRSFSDADRLKASLALVGIEADIQKVKINGGDTFHRVRSGPHSEARINALRARLKQNNISSLVIRMK
ncbi:MAG: hypothetical protein GY703_25885 [Gammaproteobacteria bacterium]|nr:hypothetical protein [Gammaproteobacteria bacterium]